MYMNHLLEAARVDAWLSRSSGVLMPHPQSHGLFAIAKEAFLQTCCLHGGHTVLVEPLLHCRCQLSQVFSVVDFLLSHQVWCCRLAAAWQEPGLRSSAAGKPPAAAGHPCCTGQPLAAGLQWGGPRSTGAPASGAKTRLQPTLLTAIWSLHQPHCSKSGGQMCRYVLTVCWPLPSSLPVVVLFGCAAKSAESMPWKVCLCSHCKTQALLAAPLAGLFVRANPRLSFSAVQSTV